MAGFRAQGSSAWKILAYDLCKYVILQGEKMIAM
jgi:hypothetical protein